jgi:hypothetical protein
MFRPRRSAKLPCQRKHPEVPSGPLRSTGYGWSLRAVGVIDDLAWTQWQTTLTGESPTPSLAGPGQPRPISTAKGSGDAAVRQSAPTGDRSGDGSCSAVALKGERSIRE